MRSKTKAFLVGAAVTALGGFVPAPAYALKTVCAQLACPPGGPTFANFHNNSAQHPEVVLVFWQDAGLNQWTSGTSSPTTTQWIGMTMSILNSPWAAVLSQYGTFGGATGLIAAPRMSPMAPVFTGPAPGTGDTTSSFHATDIDAIIHSLIASNQVPPPQQGDDVLYAVLVPGAAHSIECNANGCNDYVANNGSPYERLVINSQNPGPTLSHEIAEGITAGWQGAEICGGEQNAGGCTAANACWYQGLPAPDYWGIADICECANEAQNSTTENPFQVQAYWSAQDNACVIPESWGGLWVNPNNGSGWDGPAGGFDIRQAYGGAGGVVATGTDDNVYFYNGSEWLGQLAYVAGTPPRWTWQAKAIGAQGAEFAAGGHYVAGIPNDTKYGVNYYDLNTGKWTELGPPPSTSPGVTGVQVTSGGWIVVTDTTGSPWYWDWNASPARWVSFGGPGDQFIAMGGDILGLAVARGAVFDWAAANFGVGGGWVEKESFGGFGASQLVASPDALSLYGDVEPGGQYLWESTQNYTGEFIQYAVSGASNASFVGLAASGTVFAGTGNQFQLTNIGGMAGRLISGAQVFVTGCNTGVMPCVNY